MEQPRFPDRTKEAAEAVIIRQKEAEAAAEAARVAAEQALQAQQAAYVAPAPVVAASGSCASWMAQAGITDPGIAINIIMRESGCKPNSTNPYSGACGIGQQLPCGKWPHVWNDPVGGMIDMQNYVVGRYGSWANAWGFWQANNYY